MGFAEMFTNAALLKAPPLICHNNDYGWWEIEEKPSMAHDLGMNMWAEYYPGADFIQLDGNPLETSPSSARGQKCSRECRERRKV